MNINPLKPQPDANARTIGIQADKDESGRLTLQLQGWLDSTTTGRVWKDAVRAIEKFKSPQVLIDASKLDYCDGAGIGLLFELRRIQQGQGGTFEVHGLDEKFHRLLARFDPQEFAVSGKTKPQDISLPVEVGMATVKVFNDISALISYIGELFTALVYVFIRPGQVRWKDVFRVAESAGVNALPIVALISFLVGLIMAFQAAIPMRQFGAEIFVANLIALSMLREMGP